MGRYMGQSVGRYEDNLWADMGSIFGQIGGQSVGRCGDYL